MRHGWWVITNQLPNSIEQSSPCKADSHSSRQEIRHVLWNPKFQCCVCKSWSSVHVLMEINPSLTIPPYYFYFVRSIPILLFYLVLGLPRGLRPLRFQIKISFAFLISPSLILLFENNIWWRIKIMDIIMQFFHPPVTSSLLSPSTLLFTLFSDTTCVFHLKWETECHTHIKQMQTVVCVSVITLVDRRQEDKLFLTSW